MIKVTCTRHRARLCRRLQADGFAYFLTTANITKKKKKSPSPDVSVPPYNQCVDTHSMLKSAAEL